MLWVNTPNERHMYLQGKADLASVCRHASSQVRMLFFFFFNLRRKLLSC